MASSIYPSTPIPFFPPLIFIFLGSPESENDETALLPYKSLITAVDVT